jgi:predicted small metal-binding protein
MKKNEVSDSSTHDLSLDEVVVPVQQMFPNCRKYTKCCTDSNMEEVMKKAKKIHNYKEMIDNMLESVKENNPVSVDRRKGKMRRL